MSDQKVPPAAGLVDATLLARRVRAKRQASNLSLRAAAAEVGVSAATMSRVESNEYLPGRDHLIRLANWAGVPLGSAHPAEPSDASPHSRDASTVEAVELHLRADESLDPDDAEMLVQLVRTAYNQMANKRRK